MDLEISAPNIRFIDGTNLLSDYVMIANGDIVVDGVGPIDPNCVNIVGSLRGSNIQIQDGSRVAMDSDRIIAQNSLELGNSGKLSIGKDWFDENEESNSLSAAQGRASVWATDLKLSGSSADLETKDTDLNIRDDLTIVRDQNIVRLSGGNYYGYGNEGSGGHQNSSAILVNGKNNRLELALDSLTLAGHSWLKFADSSESSYKMAESIAQKSTQTMYLVPADQMTVTVEDASRQATNPIILAEGQTSFSLEVKLDGNTYKYKNIPVNTLASSGLADAGTWAAENSENTSASGKILLGLYNSRVYVFYNFSGTDADAQRKAFFKAFLENQEDSFNAMLQKSGWGESGSGEVNDAPGIYISTSENNIASAGSIYKMSTGSGTALYQLIEDPDATSTERTVSRINRLTGSFQNLSSYLTESGARGSSRSLLPAGQYIDPSVIRAQDQAIQTMNDGKLVVAKGDYELKLSAAKPVEGLIIAGGKVTVSGNGIFRGLIISFGMNADGTQGTGGIELSGNNMTLIADSGVVQECITGAVAEEKSAYFYDYGENAPSVLNDYEYFILESNWTRGNSGASQ
jgi:hypothetical protein